MEKSAVKFRSNRSISRTRYFMEYFREYCTNTSIHGFRYFGEQRTLFEKLWWLFIFICCSIICSLSIIAVYNKWENSPVIVTFATKPMKIYEIPFPAITICSQSKIKPKIFNLTQMNEIHRNLSEEEKKYCNYAASICYNRKNYCRAFNFSDDYFEIMNRLKTIYYPIKCNILGKNETCRTIFTPIITDEGVCFTSNMLDRDEIFSDNVVHYKNFHKITKVSTWSMERGYDKNAPAQTYPARALISGLRYGFEFEMLTMADNIDRLCQDSLEGYTVLLHVPNRIPRLSEQQFRLPLNKAVVAAVKPYIITTSPRVIRHSPKKRGCYFPTERKLKYFKLYSQINCQLECLTNCTLIDCDCVAFFMPRENGTRICGGQDVECLRDAEYHCQTNELHKNLGYMSMKYRSFETTNCDCMPMCSDIEYNAVISQTDWNWTEKASDEFYKLQTKGAYLSRFSVYFIKSDLIASQRNELYGPTDFLANFGGLLGLFTGFSFLSLMEIIYFLTIRIYANWKLYGFWAGRQPEKQQDKQQRY